jgi:hypothetical protein
MEKNILLAAALMLGGMIAPSFAFEGAAVTGLQSPVTTVTCDIRNEDEQAVCASKCDDEYIRGKQHNMTDQSKNEEEKKACDAKCGCPQNSK